MVWRCFNDTFITNMQLSTWQNINLVLDCCVDVFCLASHSDGTHSQQRIHWWASDPQVRITSASELTFHYLLYPVWLCMWQIIKNLEPCDVMLNVSKSVLIRKQTPLHLGTARGWINFHVWVNYSFKGNVEMCCTLADISKCVVALFGEGDLVDSVSEIAMFQQAAGVFPGIPSVFESLDPWVEPVYYITSCNMRDPDRLQIKTYTPGIF